MRKFRLMLIGLCLIAVQSMAQSMTISGKISDSKDGSPLSGVSVTTKDGKNGVKSDANGSYSISIPAATQVLLFTYVGFIQEQRTVRNLQTLNVVLTSDNKQLDEVVVVGYQSIKRKELTGAAGTIGGEKVSDKPIPSLLQNLQGQVPGVQVVGSSGRPGNNAVIRIRGQGSITASSEPLIVLDGIFITTSAYSLINPNDIEEVTVLKDAAATSIYGSRGSNGVILVTSKRGKGPTQVSYSYQYGQDKALELKNLTLMNAMQKFQYEYAGGYYSGNGILDSMITNRIAAGQYAAGAKLNTLSDDQRNALWTLAASRGVGDWRKLMLPNGFVKTHQVNISGSSEKTTYFLSLNKTDNNGVVYGSFFNRMGGRLNIEHRAYDWLKIGTNISIANSNENSVRELYNGQAAYTSALLLNPYEPMYVNGTYNYTSLGQNPIETTDRNPNSVNRVSTFGTMYAQVTALKHLTLKSQIGINYNTLGQQYYLQPGSYLALTLGYSQKRDNGNTDYLYVATNTANWQQTINGKHSFSVLVGSEFTKDKFYSYSLTSRGFPTASVITLENGGTPTAATTSRSDYALISYFGAIQYDFNKKYFLSLSARRDGSSRFGRNNQFANFGAIGAAWDIAAEEFLKNSRTVSTLKLRGSIGTQGNNSGFGNYQALGTYALNVNYNGQPASSPNTIANPDLTWEKQTQSNVGLDFGFFNNRLNGTIDVYNRKTTSLLYAVNISATSGFTSYTGNVGSMTNKGYELSLGGDIIRKKDFTWNVTGTYSYVKNRVQSLYSDNTPASNSGALSYLKVGEPVFVYRMVKGAGVDPGTGKYMFYNIDGTKTDTYSASQAQILSGKSPLPTFNGSILTRVNYKGFDLSAQIYYTGGNYIMNYVYQTGASSGESINNNQFTEALDYWKKAGDNAKYANLLDPTQNATYDTDNWLEKGDYISIRDVTIGYTLSKRLLDHTRIIKGLRFYIQGTNLFIGTKFHGLPEAGEANGESTAVNSGTYTLYSYPQYRSFTCGVNVKF